MARGKKKGTALTQEEKLAQALVPDWEQPYKVPENWCWVYLPNVCDYIRAGGDKPSIFSEERTAELSVPVVANGIQNEGIIGFTDIENEKAGTVTVSGRGTIGYPILREYPYYPVVRLIVLAPNKAILPNYLKNVFFCLEEEGTGSSIPQLTVPMLKGKPIPVAPINEQQRIVERIEGLFAKLDEAREKVQVVVDGFETRKAAILHKAFTGELTARWRAERGVGMDSWMKQTIGDIIKVSSGKALTSKNMVSDGAIPVYGGNGVTGYHNESNVDADTVVIGRVGFYCGSVHYIGEPAWVTDNALIVSYKQNINKQYLVHLLRYADLRQNDSSTAQPVVSGSKIYPITVTTARVDEQVEIVRILDSLFAKEQQAKETAEAVLEKIDLLKKSILARAFRGELGTNDPTEESAVELLKSIL